MHQEDQQGSGEQCRKSGWGGKKYFEKRHLGTNHSCWSHTNLLWLNTDSFTFCGLQHQFSDKRRARCAFAELPSLHISSFIFERGILILHGVEAQTHNAAWKDTEVPVSVLLLFASPWSFSVGVLLCSDFFSTSTENITSLGCRDIELSRIKWIKQTHILSAVYVPSNRAVEPEK